MKSSVEERVYIHPYCRKCGWRMGGAVDSWNGRRCKCGHYAEPISVADDEFCGMTRSQIEQYNREMEIAGNCGRPRYG